MIFDGARDFDLLETTGAVSSPRPRRRGWRRAWRIMGPILPLALAAGLIAGSALALIRG